MTLKAKKMLERFNEKNCEKQTKEMTKMMVIKQCIQF